MSEPAAGIPLFSWEEEIPTETRTSRLQQAAGEILERCRGEGPANCVSRCPLHVDARGYVQLAKEGRYQEALQRVRENLPFPGILGYLCAHPCELHCKRIDEDSAVRIRDIKRFLAEREQGKPQHILDCEPDRGKTVAVAGGGPAGLLAAHDLQRRGYRVTVFEKSDRIGGCLAHKLPEWRLPRAVTERDLSIVEALGIEVRTGVEVGGDVTLEALRNDHDAVVLLVGYEGGVVLLGGEGREMRRTIRGTLWGDPVTCETGIDGLFAGGETVSGPSTVIQSLALGRRAAESVHRYLTGADLREGREGVLPSRLLWTLEIDEEERRRRERTPVMLKPFNEEMAEAEVLEEGERCLDCECGLCVKDCEFLAKHCNSPKDLARTIVRGKLDESLDVTYSCNICSLCARVCPEDLDTGSLLLDARNDAVSRGTGPMPGHKGIVSYFNAGVSNTFSLLLPEPGRQRSKRLFFTGCGLPAISPPNTIRAYDELRKYYPGTGVLMYCCGAPVELIGMEETFDKASSEILRMAESVGAEELVPACPDCAHCLHESVPDLKITPIWELLAEKWQPPRLREGEEISIHDSCKARHMPALHDSIRKLLNNGGGVVKDIEYNRDLARCCGFGGMIYPVDSELSQAISGRRAAESELPMITYCAGCRMALAGTGKEALHILDFLLASDWRKVAGKKPPGSIGRYYNRLRTTWASQRLRPLGAE